MHTAFSFRNYALKPQGLSIAGKFRLFNPQNEAVLFIERKTKWSKPFKTFHVYADDKKKQEVLQLQDSDHPDYGEFYSVQDAAGGETLGGIAVDWNGFFEDSWAILDARGAVLAQVREKSTGRAILHEMTEGVLPKILYITVNDQPVAELRQKSVLVGHHMLVDLGLTATASLDPRLSLATAIIVAAHMADKDPV